MTARSLALGVVAALACAAPGGGAVPDSLERDRLHGLLAGATVARVTGTFGRHTLRDVRIDSAGVRSAAWGPGSGTRPALIVGGSIAVPPAPPPIAWEQITRIETGRTRTLQGAILMGGIGALLGAIVWRTVPTAADGGQGDPLVIVGVPALAGAVAGAWLGSGSYSWRPVYPTDGSVGR